MLVCEERSAVRHRMVRLAEALSWASFFLQAFDYVIKEQRTLLLTFAGRMTEEFDIRQERYRGNDGEREVENKLRPLT